MLTSFFKKSKPINFLVVGVFMTVFYGLVNFLFTSEEISFSYILKKITFLLIYLLMMLVINFIVKRNDVTKNNTFTIILFAFFTVSITPILQGERILLSGLFFLLALRRVISLRSGLEIKKKIFDASFWILLSSIFYEPAIFYMIIPLIGILLYGLQDFKNWLIPIVAVGCVFILRTCYSLLLYDAFYNPFQNYEAPSLDFEIYNNPIILIPLSVILAFSVWTLVYYFKTIQQAIRTLRPSLYLILLSLLTSIFIIVFSSQKTGSELLFFILPVCIIGANYFQQKGEKWFKEILLLTLLLLTIILPFFSL